MRLWFAAAIVLVAVPPAPAHRLDEYLQGAILSVARNRLEVEMSLTPGVAVFPLLLGQIDADGDGAISEAEQRAYAARLLGDLSIALDGRALAPRLTSARFPSLDGMKAGRGEIRIDFEAVLPAGSGSRKLTFENRHQPRIAAYQVNCLVPSDPDIRIVSQNRNYTQSHYELAYVDTGGPTGFLSLAWWSDGRAWLVPVAMLLLARFAWLFVRRVPPVAS